jgi:hypothetical protein
VAGARVAEVTQRETETRAGQAQRLVAEGKALLDREQWREALDRFNRAREILPDDPLVRQWADIAHERQRIPRSRAAVEAVRPQVAPTPATVAKGDARVELFFNCPLSVVEVELALEGERIASKAWDFRTKNWLGLKKEGSGLVTDSFIWPAGNHRITLRLKDGDGHLLADQTLLTRLEIGGRYEIKVVMDTRQSTPTISLTRRVR